MRTVCLVIPPSAFLLDDRVFMALGILRVAASLEAARYRVEMLDLSGVENFEEIMRRHAAASDALVFGLTATTPQLPAARRLVQAIRDERPDARVVLGGPHATLVNAAATREEKSGTEGRATRALAQLLDLFDVVVAGDGEEAVFEAFNTPPRRLINADDATSPYFLKGPRVARLAMPARHLVDVSTYRYEIDGARALSLIAQLGCPFGCGFCGGRASPSFRRVRMRPTSDVVAEVVHLYRTYGVTGFMFYDDELNVNPKMVELMRALSAVQRELRTEFRLRGFVKAELFTEEQAREMYRAGFRWILTGFESGAEQILTNINKKATREDNDRCMGIAHRHGLKVKALMSIGHPGESPQTVADTKEWLLRSGPDEFDLTIITTYPGSPYYDLSVPVEGQPGLWVYERHGNRLYSLELDYSTTADYYKGIPGGGYRSFVSTDFLSCEDLVHWRDEIEHDVRTALGIPYARAVSPSRYERPFGNGWRGPLPGWILRTSTSAPVAPATGVLREGGPGVDGFPARAAGV